MIRKSVIVFIALSLCSCRGNSSRTPEASGVSRIASIDYEFTSIALSRDNKVSTSDIVAGTQIIRLDSKNGLIGRINNMVVTDRHIVISDERAVFIFDREGKSIAKINRLGRAPRDYLQLSHMTLTPEGEKIVIFDNYGNKVLYFSLDGKYLYSTPGNFWFAKMEYVSSKEIVCIGYGAGKKDPGLKDYRHSENLIYFLNDKLEIKESYMPLGHERDKFGYVSPNLYKFGEGVFVNPVFGDTIYLARNNILEPLYHIDMRKIGGEANFADKITDAEFDALVRRATTFSGRFTDSDSHLFLSVATPPQRRVEDYLYSKKSGEAYLVEQKSANAGGNLLDNILLMARTSYKDKLVSVVDAYGIVAMLNGSPNALPELSGIREEDNPVIVLYTLKDNL